MNEQPPVKRVGRPHLNDEWGHRTDLTSAQKYRLRHPEYYLNRKSKHASEMRVWRDNNPDREKDIQDKRRKKLLLEKVRNFKESRSRHVTTSQCNHAKSVRKEIMGLYSRGKSMADICVWLKVPMSAVMKVIQENTTTVTP